MADEPTTRPDIVEQAARVVSEQIFGHRDPGPHSIDIARALADAGLLAEPLPTHTVELLDAAAERGHAAVLPGELPRHGVERDQWHKIVLAILDDPRLLPHWARAARLDADNWHRQCNQLDAELEEWRAVAGKGGGGWSLARVREALGTPDGRAVSVHAAEVRKERDTWEAEYERVRDLKLTDLADALAERDERQARIDAALAVLTEPTPHLQRTDPGLMSMNARRNHEQLVGRVRAALQGDQPAEPGGSETGGNAAAVPCGHPDDACGLRGGSAHCGGCRD